ALFLALFSWKAGRLSTRSLSARLVGFGVVWFVITAAPTSNLVFLSGVLLAERTLYLPSVGFVAGLAWLLASFHRTRPVAAASLAVLCLSLMSYRTVTRNPTWKDNLAVFSTMLAEHPESGRAQWVAGDLHYQRGRDAEGMAAYRRAIGMVGGHYTLVVEVGRSLVAHGEERVGEFLLRHAWQDRPEFPLAPSLLTPLYDRQERWGEAEASARSALSVDSTNAIQAHLLSKALEAQGRLDEAVEVRHRAIDLGEDRWEQWAWLSELEMQRGDTLTAISHLDTARTRVRGPGELAAVDSTRQALLERVSQR
ncbi:MAG: tetratricopeptide repeat protein, partial [Gemmatimonadetes bacterium]|nr:tetratricopeptide repeat protein [Gemmatimonadota bacterium]